MKRILKCWWPLAAILATGCATTEPPTEESMKWQATDRAIQLLEEQGKAAATIRHYAMGNEAGLICERVRVTGTHMKTNFCYTREEWGRTRLNHQENWRYMMRPPPRVVE